MSRNVQCRIACTPADQVAVEAIYRQVRSFARTGVVSEDLPPALRPESISFILDYYGEPVGTIRLDMRTPHSRLPVEELLDYPTTREEQQQVSGLIERLLRDGPVASISNWNVLPNFQRAPLPLGGILFAVAIRYCESQSIFRVLGSMDVGTAQNRFMPRMAEAIHILRFQHPLYQTTRDLWLADLRTINAFARNLIDTSTKGVLDLSAALSSQRCPATGASSRPRLEGEKNV